MFSVRDAMVNSFTKYLVTWVFIETLERQKQVVFTFQIYLQCTFFKRLVLHGIIYNLASWTCSNWRLSLMTSFIELAFPKNTYNRVSVTSKHYWNCSNNERCLFSLNLGQTDLIWPMEACRKKICKKSLFVSFNPFTFSLCLEFFG